jgi:hypothetical protein
MITFPELVFAHAVLELRMSLDDYIKMDGMHATMYRKGRRIQARMRAFLRHDLLQGKWPAMRASLSTNLPLIKITSTQTRISWSKDSILFGVSEKYTSRGKPIHNVVSTDGAHHVDEANLEIPNDQPDIPSQDVESESKRGTAKD